MCHNIITITLSYTTWSYKGNYVIVLSVVMQPLGDRGIRYGLYQWMIVATNHTRTTLLHKGRTLYDLATLSPVSASNSLIVGQRVATQGDLRLNVIRNTVISLLVQATMDCLWSDARLLVSKSLSTPQDLSMAAAHIFFRLRIRRPRVHYSTPANWFRVTTLNLMLLHM